MTDSNEQANDVTELKAHYVYVLIDPRDNDVFYVGMGQGRRGNQHLQDALKEQENDESTWSEKIRRILAIKQAGSEPRTVVVARFNTREEAFAVESVFIKWVYGLSNLTNKVHGHGHDSIRTKDDFQSNLDLDIQRRVRMVVIADEYTQENHSRIIASKLDVYLAERKDLVEAYHEDWTISNITLESINISFYITVLDVAKIECYLPAKAKYGSPIKIRVRSMNGRPSINFTQLATRLNCTINNPNRNPYFRLEEDNINDDLITRLSIYDGKLQP